MCWLCFNNTSEINACRCHNECEEEFASCRQVCIDNFNGLTNLVSCIELCQSQHNACKNRCGENPEPAGNITGYVYRFIYSYASIPFNPLNSSKLEITPAISVQSNSVIIPPISLVPTSAWPDVFFEANTCIGFQLAVFYDHREEPCIFQNIECNIIG